MMGHLIALTERTSLVQTTWDEKSVLPSDFSGEDII